MIVPANGVASIHPWRQGRSSSSGALASPSIDNIQPPGSPTAKLRVCCWLPKPALAHAWTELGSDSERCPMRRTSRRGMTANNLQSGGG